MSFPRPLRAALVPKRPAPAKPKTDPAELARVIRMLAAVTKAQP